MKAGPLVGVRVIEMDAIGPVPLCGMILSGLGAEMIRIARPGGQQAYDDLGETILHRGRTTVELNIKDECDKARFLELVEQSDALIEGMRPGVMERLGIGPEVCLARNPAFVFGRATGWGQHGSLAPRAGHDLNYISMAGALHPMGPAASPPPVPLNLVGDYAGGTMFLALGVVSAVLSARRTGVGQEVDAAILDGTATLLSLFHAYLSTGNWKEERQANFLDGGAPYYRCYRCSDGGFIAVGALEPNFFAQLLEGLGIAQDRWEQTNQSHWPEMAETFAASFATMTRDHWEAVFAGTDACVSPVLTMREAMTHPANVARSVFVERGGTLQAAPAPRFSETPGAISESRTIKIEELLAANRAGSPSPKRR